MIKKALFLLCCLVIGGCMQTKFHLQDRDDAATATYDEAQHYFIFRLGQQKNIDAVALCKGIDKVKRVETETTFVNGLLGAITMGIYFPQQARVYCSK